MRVKILQLNPDAKVNLRPSRSLDYCLDLTAVSCEQIAPNTYRYGFGIALQIDRQWNAELIANSGIAAFDDSHLDLSPLYIPFSESPLRLAFHLYPRSSVWRTGMLLTNSVGIIDEGFIGEITATFYHYDTTKPRYQPGDRIAQIALEASLPISLSSAVYLEPTERGSGAYGSTGK